MQQGTAVRGAVKGRYTKKYKVYCIQNLAARKSLMSLYTRDGLAVFLFLKKFFLRGQNSEKATLCSNIILTKMLKYEKCCLKTVKKL